MTNSNSVVAVADVTLTPHHAAIYEMVKAAGGSIIDDHSTGHNIVLKGLATLDHKGVQRVVALCAGIYFSLNHVYEEDGVVHLSRNSVGGVVKLLNKETMAEAIDVYNKAQATSPWTTGSINNVVMF